MTDQPDRPDGDGLLNEAVRTFLKDFEQDFRAAVERRRSKEIRPMPGVPTGIEAAKIVAEYLTLRLPSLDEGDAANIIHILHEAGVCFALPTRDGAEGARVASLRGTDPELVSVLPSSEDK